MGSYDKRSQKIAQSFAKLLNEAGVKFAIFGNKEKNSGDTPRRIGNEFLYQELAASNISEFQKHNVKKIVTIDPHAYNTFKNEYPEFGLEDVEEYHHTEFLAVYDSPRDIFEAIPGLNITEMERNRQDDMCCGAGEDIAEILERSVVGDRQPLVEAE